jgi:hypothetical protein
MVGNYDVEKFLKFYRELLSDENVEQIDAIIWDATELKVGHVTINEIDYVIEHIHKASEKRKGGKAAWVVANRFGFGMGRMFELMSEDKIRIDIKVFYDLNEAKEWILKD